MVNIANNNSDEDFRTYFQVFQTMVKDTSVINKIKNNYLVDFTSFKNKTKEVYLSSVSKKNQTLSSLILKNKGKVIYVDFWASWCAPCLAQMPSSRTLKNDYQNKDVAFIYLSIDKDFEKWKNASSKERLNDNNFLSINYPTASFYQELKIKTIPRYLIYDRKGNLVHKNAPDPGSEEVRNELNKYLNL